MDFQYVHVPNPTSQRATGRVRFLHARAGLWMVDAWRLRVPRVAASMEPGLPLVFNGWYEFGAELAVIPSDARDLF